MIITRQIPMTEIDNFINQRNPFSVKTPSELTNSMDKIQIILKWCRENFIDDAAVRFDPHRKTGSTAIEWLIANEMDLMAFKLKWLQMGYEVKISHEYQNPLVEWCFDNKIEGYSIWVSAWNTGGYRYLFEFQKEEDAVAFKLRWK